MKKIIYILLFIISQFYLGQIIPMEVDEMKQKSNYIVEGVIISEKSFKENGTIKTDFTLKVNQTLKGNISEEQIVIRSLGGKLDDIILTTCPSDGIGIGLQGTFLLQKKGDHYETAFFGQSVIDASSINGDLVMPINTTSNRNPLLSITSISPQEIILGNNDILTITGSGFGSTGPTSAMKVWLLNFDNSYFVPLSDPLYYVSWSDTEIKIKIPSRTLSGFTNPPNNTYLLGSGKLRVGNGNSYVTSSQSYTVKAVIRDYPNFNYSNIFPITLPALSNGGINFIPNTNFTNTDALQSLRYAMDLWTCNTGIKLSVDNTQTTSALTAVDGISSLYFDSTLSSNTLGVTYVYFNTCNSVGRYYVSDIDLAFNPNVNFMYTTSGTPTSSQIDFFSVALHELGHVRNLLHVNNPNKLMHPSISPGQVKRTLHPHEIEAGNWVQNDSETTVTCSKPLMNPGVCQNLIVENFADVKNKPSLYPNPFSDHFNINFTKNETGSIDVYDESGRVFSKNQFTNTSKIKIDTNKWSTGVYIANVKLKNETFSYKIIKKN